jgi:hypothetical protein
MKPTRKVIETILRLFVISALLAGLCPAQLAQCEITAQVFKPDGRPAAGANKTTLLLRGESLTRPMVYNNFARQSDAIAAPLKQMGIRLLVVSNGKQSWAFKTRSPGSWQSVLTH